MAGMRVTVKQLVVARDYLVNYNDADAYNDAIPSMVGLALALDTPRHSLTNLKRLPPNPKTKTAAATRQREMLRILDRIHDQQHQDLVNGSLRGTLNSNIAKLVLGKHDYHDKQDTTVGNPDGTPLDTAWTVRVVKPDA